jgi:LuxR family transcriptional regulator, maltose regulon positive regulatory protein
VPFLLHPALALLERQVRHRAAHASLIDGISSLLTGTKPAPRAGAQPLLEPLSDSEIRVLRYPPTNLSTREIANELYAPQTP